MTVNNQDSARRGPHTVATDAFQSAMVLLEQIAEHIPISAMTTPVNLGNVPFDGSYDDAAHIYYGLSKPSKHAKSSARAAVDEKEDDKLRDRSSSSVPFVASLQQLTGLTSYCVQLLLLEERENAHFPPTSDIDNIQTTFMSGLSLILFIVRAFNKQPPLTTPLQASWDPEGWMDSLADLLTSKVDTSKYARASILSHFPSFTLSESLNLLYQ